MLRGHLLNTAAPEGDFIYICTTGNPLYSFVTHFTWKTSFVSRGKFQASQQEHEQRKALLCILQHTLHVKEVELPGIYGSNSLGHTTLQFPILYV